MYQPRLSQDVRSSKELYQLPTMMISLFVLISQLDPALGSSVRSNHNEPYGILPPVYPFNPHPSSIPEHIVHSNRPIICNNKTEYECVCMKPFISKHSNPKNFASAPDCSVFIKTDDLPVIDMRMRNMNTEELLYTGQSYEEYFKMRVASIVSQYCQHNTNECPGVTLRMSHEQLQKLSDDEADSLDLDKSVLYAERDESEPLLNKENVVILRMDHLRGNNTRILFVLTKNDRNAGIVDENMIIDPTKVKYILASQVTPLSRVLGGIKIDSVRAAKLKRNTDVIDESYATPKQREENRQDNTTLIRVVLIVGTFFLTTYCIACVQCIRFFHKKRKSAQEAKLAETSHVATTDCKNYGTCESQRKPSRNGHIHVEERIPLTYEPIDESANDDSQPLSERQMRNWFICDSSQLPREPTYPTSLKNYDESKSLIQPSSTPNPTDDMETKEESPILTKKEPKSPVFSSQTNTSSEAIFPPSKDFSDYVEDQFIKSRASSNSPEQLSPKSPMEDPWDEIPSMKSSVPPVVLLQSDTPDIPLVNQILSNAENAAVEAAKISLRSGDSPTFVRPRSRRGSRIDEEEGQLDIPELKPLHHDDPLEDPLDAPVPINSIKGSVDEEDRWSSSEEGDVDVYYKMSDDEDVTREELDWKKAMAKSALEKEAKNQGQKLPGAQKIENARKNETPPSSPIQQEKGNHSDSEEADDKAENVHENENDEHDDAFVYERLREELSPHPPIVVDLDTTDLDLDPIKSLPPPPPGMFPDSPPDSFQTQRSQEEMNSSDDEDSLR